MGDILENRIWITWETQRRSLELAKILGCKLFVIEVEGRLRYLKSILKTLKILKTTKPQICFVQNPSMILATIACVYGIMTRTKIVVDRHTTFLLSKSYRLNIKLLIFKLLHRFTIKYADLTIVTNDFLSGIVWQLGGRPFVLPDKLPEITSKTRVPLKGKINILMISSFGKDEPIENVLKAMEPFESQDVFLYISGNYKKLDIDVFNKSPSNVIFTGFIPDDEFVNMIFSVDAVMALTTSDYCMLCGCYEALSAEKPLITSNKDVLRDYFQGAIFVNDDNISISNGISLIINNLKKHQDEISMLKGKIQSK